MEFNFINVLLILAMAIVCVLMGIHIGQKIYFPRGFMFGVDSAEQYWKDNLPEKTYLKVKEKQLNRLMDILSKSEDDLMALDEEDR